MRLELQRRTDLGLRALRHLAGNEGNLKAQDLGEAIGTSAAFVARVMAPLVQAGWVVSEPGRRGGYRLVAPAAGISVLQLIETMEGPIDNGRCVLRHGPCPGEEVCALHQTWIEARDALVAGLAAVSVIETDEER